jgi:uncharacterized protein Veg
MSEEIIQNLENIESEIQSQVGENVEIDAETQARMEEVNKIIEAESIEPTVAINIIVNAVQVSFDKDHFNDLDRYLISKALSCLKEKIDAGEDFIIKVK